MKKIKAYFRTSTANLCSDPKVKEFLIKTFRRLPAEPQASSLNRFLFRRSRWCHTMFAQFLRQLGDSVSAYEILLKGLPHHPTSHLLHFRISQILRENYEISESHRYLEIAEQLRPGTNTMLKLFFESEYQLFDHGTETMSKVLDLPLELVRKQINLIDRVSVHYPEHKERLQTLRDNIQAALSTQPHSGTESLSRAMAQAIGQRQVRLAMQLQERHADITPSPEIQKRLERILHYFGRHLDLLDAAWDNENSETVHFYSDGRRVSSENEIGSRKIVELFLPPALFDYPPREKQTHETIRETFLNIVETLCERTDVAIVPRMQLNWRICLPKTTGAHVISYHTSNEYDRRHIHVQESPFSGKCSFDYAGFAGFSHIARNHEAISDFVRNVSPSDLADNQANIYNKYVLNNISKYKQPDSSEPITGPYVFVALQVVTDVVAKLAWMTGTELLESVASHYRGSGIQVVVKRHPFCRSMNVQKCLERLEAAGDIMRTTNSIHEILKNAQLVFTVNSGVGLEALMHGKPVIVSGECDYSYAAHPVKTPGQLHELLATSPTADERRIRELLYFYIHSFSIASDDKSKLDARISDWLSQ